MITGIPLKQHRPDWQLQMAQAVSDPAELLRSLCLDPSQLGADLSETGFRLKVPMAFIQRMEKGNPTDPLLLQVLTRTAEHAVTPGFVSDPVGDLNAMQTPGLIQKYSGRALLVVTGACAVHCRYCFRRHFPYGEANLSREHWDQALDYLRENPDIHEIILSGGDPLALPDHRLHEMLCELEEIPHLKRLRIHTRLPVVIPDRVTDEFVALLNRIRLRTCIVVHINHAQEIDSSLSAALAKLRQSDATLLNQAVLLKDINDSVQSQSELAESLYESGVLPYYLHLLDPVDGSAHFDIGASRAQNIHESLRKALPGYLVPRLVRETPGEPYKTPIESIQIVSG
ncbi:MAG: EF-P beta-lysylation protein EpmB [Gammaproteobacteria bacterium]|nr:EF-P beta-lysylation protein EpmB [Gammaproteobacteria bacterium]